MNIYLYRSIFSNYDKLVKPDERTVVTLGINAIGLKYCHVREVTD